MMRGARPEIDPRVWGASRPGEMDSAAWGRVVPIKFSEPTFGQPTGLTSIIRGNLEMSEEVGELFVRTYALGIQERTQQPDGVVCADPELADAPVVARIVYGIGGASIEAEVNIGRGTMITVPATMWDIGARIEQVPDMTGVPGTMYPDATTGPKTITVFCVASLGTHPGGSVPKRDLYARAGIGNPAVTTLKIPASGSTLTIQGDGNFVPAALTVVYVGAQGALVAVWRNSAANTPSIVPAQATHVQIIYPAGNPDTLITVSFGISI